jgi:predicted GNAT family N-acyltransferase
MTISQLDKEYPNFQNWYYNKVKNNILSGGRDIHFTIVDEYIAGVAILKNTIDEKKICTLRVSDSFQKKGIGKSLIKNSIDYLGVEKPLITVSSFKDYQFKKIFKYFGFEKCSELQHYYSLNSLEMTYNGIL